MDKFPAHNINRNGDSYQQSCAIFHKKRRKLSTGLKNLSTPLLDTTWAVTYNFYSYPSIIFVNLVAYAISEYPQWGRCKSWSVPFNLTILGGKERMVFGKEWNLSEVVKFWKEDGQEAEKFCPHNRPHWRPIFPCDGRNFLSVSWKTWRIWYVCISQGEQA